jgi:trimethylamine--corrinoid protein Co-methyltransferase
MVPEIRILSDQELREIDRATRELLEEVGIIVNADEALDIYRAAGAVVEFDQNLVRIPRRLIEETLKKCSPCIRLYGRDGASPLIIGDMHSYFSPTGFATKVLDHETGKYRPALFRDLVESIRLAEVLNPPDFILANIGPTDVPSGVVDLYEFKAGLINTRKHLMTQAHGKESLRKIISMAQEVTRDSEATKKRPFFSILVTLTSPLNIRQDAAELIIEGAREGLPLFIESGPMCGVTAPATLASTLVCANAELLGSFVLAKLVNPTIPLVYASWARILDMRTGTVSVGGPEFGMLRIATTQMAKYYRLPSGGGGTLSDSKLNNAQLGMEKLSTTLLPALAGTNMIMGMGLLAEMNAASLETLMIDHEITAYVRRVLKGIEVADDTIDLTVFKDVGPRGCFIQTDHTYKHFRKEMWIPEITDRGGALSEDLDPGLWSLENRARKGLVEALQKHTPPNLPKDIDSKLDAIIHG